MCEESYIWEQFRVGYVVRAKNDFLKELLRTLDSGNIQVTVPLGFAPRTAREGEQQSKTGKLSS